MIVTQSLPEIVNPGLKMLLTCTFPRPIPEGPFGLATFSTISSYEVSLYLIQFAQFYIYLIVRCDDWLATSTLPIVHRMTFYHAYTIPLAICCDH